MVLRESKCLFADLFEVIAVSKKKGDVQFHFMFLTSQESGLSNKNSLSMITMFTISSTKNCLT